MWAYEYEAGKFIAGEILGGTLYMYAPTGRGEKWVMNSEGIVLEYSSEPFHKSDEIIAGINAHYGTTFYQEDDIDKDFTIGETMPNWNAYEKIEMPPTIYAKITPQGSSLWTIGKILGNTFKILCQNDDGAWQVTNDGKINGVFGRPYDLMSYMWAPKLQQAGYEISAFEIELVSYNVGDTIENWEYFIEL